MPYQTTPFPSADTNKHATPVMQKRDHPGLQGIQRHVKTSTPSQAWDFIEYVQGELVNALFLVHG